jgi:lipoate-protein ligase A
MPGRLLEVETGDPFSNVALEEAILRQDGRPTLRVWENQRSVVIGRAQLAQFETDLEYCEKNSIPVIRRVTAGGAVYHGPGNLNWSFFVPRASEGGGWNTRDAKRVFASFARLVVEALWRCGVECEFRPPNSIVNRVGKVSGMAAYISKGRVLCHGTLLARADLAEARRLTRPKGDRLDRRYPRSKFVEMANCGVGREEFVEELASRSKTHFESGRLTLAEKEAAAALLPRYRSDAWNLGDPFASDDL